MAGGTITVTWQDASTTSFAIPVPGVGLEDSAIVTQPGFFSFRQDNDTLTNNQFWRLTNTRAGFLIVSFTIDLTNATTAAGTAVFDSGVAPLAPGSNTNVQSFYGGTDGVRAVSGGTISSYSFTSQYLGDGGSNMFRMLSVSLASGLTSDSTNGANVFTFNADTDLITGVPEPSTWAVMTAFTVGGLWVRAAAAKAGPESGHSAIVP